VRSDVGIDERKGEQDRHRGRRIEDTKENKKDKEITE
jgi:hypothetical protein